ncbi:hypothetical protein GWP26_09810 [Corynebacterium macginleyi]|uniref:hypothetical protein n=1 Tax=Corynebacterium macginleyi TaxID=38290 RepID=UPI00190A6027|nr:hypothetical protein [Corynebacterium macginleyi]MBK4181134.1 hypothetical protein [Corynebacterium macginleyi]
MKKPNDSFFGKLMQGLFAFFVLYLLQKVFPENERVEESECENREVGEEKKDSWTKLKKAVGKPSYGDIAFCIIQILLFAVVSAATLEQEWFIEEKPIALVFFFAAWAICVFIYCVASDGAMSAFVCLVGIVVLTAVSGLLSFLALKGLVAYVTQLVFQAMLLALAAFASKQIKSGHTGS